MENDLMQKLMKSKAIMDVHNKMPRASDQTKFNINPNVEEFNAPSAKYNIPQEFIQESRMLEPKNLESPSVDAIKNSKLPDEIKRIMMEHPITPQQNISSEKNILTDSLIKKANTLMGNSPQKKQQATKQSENISLSDIKNIVQETVKQTIKEMGLLTESTEKSNEMFQFRVGSHLFEGKVTKIKKLKV
jgi:hypothetical protein